MISPRGWKNKFKSSEKRQRENYQQQEEQDVKHRVGGKAVKGRSSENGGHYQTNGHIYDYDAQTV